MKIIGVLLLILLPRLSCFGQTPDPVFYRGWQLNVSLGYEREQQQTILPYFRAGDTLGVQTFQEDRLSVGLPENGETTNYYLVPEAGFSSAVGNQTLPYNLQLRLHRKFLNGLEYSIGGFYRSGNFSNVNPRTTAGISDFAYQTIRETYRQFGVSSSLGVVILPHRRVQPFIVAQALLLRYHQQIDHQGVYYTRLDRVVPTDLPAVEFRGYLMNFRLLTGLTYCLSENYAIGFETRLFPDFDRLYAALNLRYRITRY
jgi:hypothetical protein